ncbi:MAG: PorV/PorQ family protein [Ignavibacteriae bacterium]|nr:PorV/PorQ family protein [Ignavibacteriota bacterium]
MKIFEKSVFDMSIAATVLPLNPPLLFFKRRGRGMSSLIFTQALKVGAILLILVVAVSTSSHAQLFRSTTKVGTTAAQFLKIGVGARAIGMGSAQAAMQGDISAIYWNPGALSRLNVTSELTFNHVEWLGDINYDFAAGVLQLENFGTLGLSVISLRVPEDVVRTVDFPEGDGRTWDGSSLAIGLAYAKSLTDRFSIGFNAKFVRESIWSESASGFALDFGTLYNSEIPGLSLGASISNFGTKMRLSGRDLQFNNDPNNNEGSGPNQIPSEYTTESFDMPLSFRIGIAYDLRLADEFRATTAIDATHPNDNTEYVNSGLELAWRETLFARVGYKALFLRDTEQGLTWGLGLHYTLDNSTTIKLDYGFAEFGRLKNVQYFSLGVGL